MGEESLDALEGLEARLQSHAKAFDSLLALTPAREYYGNQIDDGQDPSEQWNRKKQTKEQKKAAKKAKLDPANQRSALDVMKEAERKRKRELGMDDDEDEAQKEDGEAAGKRQKTEDDADTAEAKRRAKAEKRKQKRQEKKEFAQKKKEKKEAKKAAKERRDLEDLELEKRSAAGGGMDGSDSEAGAVEQDAELEDFDVSGLADHPEEGGWEDEEEQEASTAPTSPRVDSPAFDVDTNQSTASSTSSILPPSDLEKPHQPKPASAKPAVNTKIVAASSATASALQPKETVSGTSSPKIQLPDIDQAELQERLKKRIEELRAKRKADGADGRPAKSRQELLEQRRNKEEQRKAAKKEQRRNQKEEEQRKREQQLRDSPSSADVFSSRPSPAVEQNNFSFSRLAFEDGTAADANLSSLQEAKKRKGPQDPRTALEAAQKKQARLAGLGEGKRADVAEKDLWLNAKKRAHGERVRDDTSLLKKALKRKEKQKGKSEKEWKERQEAVVHGKETKQKKREENLRKRKEEKGGGGKKKGAQKSGPKKKGARPGFEGRFKA
ncbi:SURF6-domain-containing protein [Teratosphaeria nubilosa]|uniref:SURF6-domain-containing protein n=1 Tax=Teratosphaeria nubilosa TaxID=161662 RepID=A0A6G1LJ27_9PEZI|nr:SURF6-domain-containing protein [Teratosphaeria nubilosa]